MMLGLLEELLILLMIVLANGALRIELNVIIDVLLMLFLRELCELARIHWRIQV